MSTFYQQHPRAIIGGLIGLLLGISILIFGIWQSLFLILLIIIGVGLGIYWPNLRNLITQRRN
ncbi:DUF2273 domain-containing protein [Lactobacillus sp. DCY120]|uniref:DUF2273 domain-containing protein n=1 Tax=Bombilactobacillus apium TaxID=2675299 RepID=A0A850RD39_9LACO|nr:DUF2273 domain-containing protein [Bombilactobacillus apium]NVY96678.1 DUF2273 domain-containing protein [Bombilactobacillus apium]